MNLATKYGPKTLADYKTHHQPLTDLIRAYTDGKTSDPLLLHGPPGTGKTRLAGLLPYALCSDFNPANAEMMIDAGLDTGINKIRAAKAFCEMYKANNDNFTAIIIDECDRLSGDAMDALKHLLPAYQSVSGMRVQFVLTTNHITRIPGPVRDRCQQMLVPQPTPEALIDFAMSILEGEGQSYDRDLIYKILQTNTSRDGTLSYRELYKRLERLLAL